MKYVTKPVVIEAVQYKNGMSINEVVKFMGEDAENFLDLKFFPNIKIVDQLQNSVIKVNFGDYIIRGTKGEYYPCDEEVFHEKYQKVED